MATTYIIMGVSGCGKTTIGELLAAQLNMPFYDADDFHPAKNIAKMSGGIPLNDDDRLPWLQKLAEQIKVWNDEKGAVLACSALKESYRQILKTSNNVQWIVLSGSFEIIMKRMKQRGNHYMDASMLQSQFDVLELPEYGIHLDIEKTREAIVSAIIKNLKPPLSEFGIIGLGVMGRSLAKNILNKDISLSVFNRSEGGEKHMVSDFLTEVNTEHVQGFTSIEGFITSLQTPRKILLMIPAGAVVDSVLKQLIPCLSEGDIVIDGGNSHFEDTQRRSRELENQNIHFTGIGISGGEEGALNGPSIMVGGDKEAYAQIQTVLEALAAKDASGHACVSHLGPEGCGHFIKMIHNGIEYAEMQLLAELFSILKPSLSYREISNLFSEWNSSGLSSYLLEITANILNVKEEKGYLLDLILDKASSKGTGTWSSEAALKLGTPATLTAAAVNERYLSMLKEKRTSLAAEINSSEDKEKIDPQILKDGYTFARIINHYQGFEIIRSASKEYGWNVSLAEIARIWTNGCIIKSEFMSSLAGILNTTEDLLESPKIIQQLKETEIAATKLIQYAALTRTALPCFSAALNYWYGITTGESSANLIQAQRDYFGAHGYQRTDSGSDQSFTTKWNLNNG